MKTHAKAADLKQKDCRGSTQQHTSTRATRPLKVRAKHHLLVGVRRRDASRDVAFQEVASLVDKYRFRHDRKKGKMPCMLYREAGTAPAGAATSSLVTVHPRQLYQPTVPTTLSINSSSEVKVFSRNRALGTSPFKMLSQRASFTLFQCSIPRGAGPASCSRVP